jgi:hypothetical protein
VPISDSVKRARVASFWSGSRVPEFVRFRRLSSSLVTAGALAWAPYPPISFAEFLTDQRRTGDGIRASLGIMCDPLRMVDRPSGTVTFLFTDVEGSTRLWEEHPTEMQVGLQRHDEIPRTAIESRGGYVFPTAGDAFAASFARPGNALDAAIGAGDVGGPWGTDLVEWGR